MRIAIYLILALAFTCAINAKTPKEFSDEFTKPITFRFLDENGKPIAGKFTLHQTKNGKYHKNWHRYVRLNDKGEITIHKFPTNFEFGGTSYNKFYHYWIKSSDLDPKKDSYVHRCFPSGAMKFKITEFPKKHYASLVVEYHKKMNDGSDKRVKGIGIFPDDPEHTIGGLEPGEYFIAIKFHYEDKKPIFKSAPFNVKLKEYTSLPKIKITESSINASKR